MILTRNKIKPIFASIEVYNIMLNVFNDALYSCLRKFNHQKRKNLAMLINQTFLYKS